MQLLEQFDVESLEDVVHGGDRRQAGGRRELPRCPCESKAHEPACLSAPSGRSRSGTGRLRDGTLAMGWAEVRKLRHDHLDIFTRSVQPLLWLFIFGTALQNNRTLSGGFHDYRAYLVPGVMAQAALFVAIFSGLGLIWERDLGIIFTSCSSAPRLSRGSCWSSATKEGPCSAGARARPGRRSSSSSR